MSRTAVALVTALAAVGCDERPTFSPEELAGAKVGTSLPAGFLFGTATAAHQIEGGNENDWTDWEDGVAPDGSPRIANGDKSGRADGSWALWPADVRAMRDLGANAYRFSVEWSRLEPSEGVWDEAAAAVYRRMLLRLRGEGITPMVTLHHFTFPRWVAARGGWEWEGVADALAAFAAQAGTAYGDLVDYWCTVNEPNVAAYEGYLDGTWPPGVQDAARMAQVYARALKAHARAAAALRLADVADLDRDGFSTRIGMAHHVRVFEPASWSTLDFAVSGLTDDFFNEAVPRAVKTGRILLSIPGTISIDESVPELVGSIDYLGLNYYERDFMRFNAGNPSLSTHYVPEDRPESDLGWDLYPEGLYRMLVRFGRHGWPVYVTENGIADASGNVRPEFLRSSVFALEKARERGVDVRGYFHWSLMDNFEWAEGYGARFGLFSVDFADPDLTRRRTPAVGTFREIARNLGLSPVGP